MQGCGEALEGGCHDLVGGRVCETLCLMPRNGSIRFRTAWLGARLAAVHFGFGRPCLSLLLLFIEFGKPPVGFYTTLLVVSHSTHSWNKLGRPSNRSCRNRAAWAVAALNPCGQSPRHLLHNPPLPTPDPSAQFSVFCDTATVRHAVQPAQCESQNTNASQSSIDPFPPTYTTQLHT